VGLTGRKSIGLDDSFSQIESGASKVNTVYGKTRVESDITRSRDATGYLVWMIVVEIVIKMEEKIRTYCREACKAGLVARQIVKTVGPAI
jgi:hypothetical protein